MGVLDFTRVCYYQASHVSSQDNIHKMSNQGIFMLKGDEAELQLNGGGQYTLVSRVVQ